MITEWSTSGVALWIEIDKEVLIRVNCEEVSDAIIFYAPRGQGGEPVAFDESHHLWCEVSSMITYFYLTGTLNEFEGSR